MRSRMKHLASRAARIGRTTEYSHCRSFVIDRARWVVPPTIDTSDSGENMVVGRAYIRVRVPDGKLAAPLLDVLVDLVTGACGLLSPGGLSLTQ